MLLKYGKQKLAKIIKIKSSSWLTLLLSFFLGFFIVFNSGFKEEVPFSFKSGLESKLKVKVNYLEGPNRADFFSEDENEDKEKEKSNKFLDLGPFEKLGENWTGQYFLNEGDIFWVNPGLEKLELYNSINHGPYNLYLMFNFLDLGKLTGLDIFQEDVKYDLATIQIVNDKQINYWTKASSRDWLEIIRGKVFRINNDELFTVFQTTVYEKKTPIYAFKGEVVLKKG